MTMEYRLIRSNRKTLGISVSPKGEVIVRAPLFLSDEAVEKEVLRAEAWIKKAVAKSEHVRNCGMYADISAETERELRKKAAELLPPLIDKYSKRMGVYPAGVKVTSAKTRFGSCSGKNALCFSYRLMQYPVPEIEAVVVHELAHIKYKNHGKEFYNFIYSVMPDYEERRRGLK